MLITAAAFTYWMNDQMYKFKTGMYIDSPFSTALFGFVFFFPFLDQWTWGGVANKGGAAASEISILGRRVSAEAATCRALLLSLQISLLLFLVVPVSYDLGAHLFFHAHVGELQRNTMHLEKRDYSGYSSFSRRPRRAWPTVASPPHVIRQRQRSPRAARSSRRRRPRSPTRRPSRPRPSRSASTA